MIRINLGTQDALFCYEMDHFVHGIAGYGAELTLAEKVEFLSRPETYPIAGKVICRETHMSWVFLAGDRAYKLKKPVRFPYLDFSTIARREAACRAELRLNRRLAPDIYLDIAALTSGMGGLSINGPGTTVDWLVVMRRLDDHHMLDCALAEGRIGKPQLDRLIATLARFYRNAAPVFLSPALLLAEWARSIAYNRRILLDSRLGMPAGLVMRIDQAQRRFLARGVDILTARVRSRRIVDGHGDLRPEHIWLGDPIRIIDCLEFNPRLRAVDSYDEIAFLSLECERLGAAWASDYIKRRMMQALHDRTAEDLFIFYRCHRATLRARLAIAHLLEPNPRTPEKWPGLARTYLAIAARDAGLFNNLLNRRVGR